MKSNGVKYKKIVVKNSVYSDYGDRERNVYIKNQETIKWGLRKGMRIVCIDEVYFSSRTYKNLSFNSSY